jgi:G:T/U-mismatch repair DNA glycosylase
MKKVTRHLYLDRYPVHPEAEKLIVGTIHPHAPSQFQLPFFYGNRLSLWKILQQAFPEDFGSELTMNSILGFLNKHRIAMSDTIRECIRTNDSASDQDLIPTRLNWELPDQIRQSHIREIFFTSSFQKNNAFKLFYADILGRRITNEIRHNREVMLEPGVFGRPVKLTILYSPSGAANRAWVQTQMWKDNKHKYANSPTPLQDFKVDYYREKFS